ncbi:hypothetical protein [Nostoc sp.]
MIRVSRFIPNRGKLSVKRYLLPGLASAIAYPPGVGDRQKSD